MKSQPWYAQPHAAPPRIHTSQSAMIRWSEMKPHAACSARTSGCVFLATITRLTASSTDVFEST